LGLADFTYNFSAYGENCIDETTCMHARKGDEFKDLIIRSYAPYTIDVKHKTFAFP
jgi:hypothetical protein